MRNNFFFLNTEGEDRGGKGKGLLGVEGEEEIGGRVGEEEERRGERREKKEAKETYICICKFSQFVCL